MRDETVMDDEARRASAMERVRDARRLARDGDSDAALVAWRDAFALAPSLQAAAMGLVSALLGRGAQADAEAALRAFVGANPGPAGIAMASRQWSAWAERGGAAGVFRAALVGTGTLEPLGDYLRVALAQAGFHPIVTVGGFNQWAPELLDPGSLIWSSKPELVIVRLDAADLIPQTIGDAFLPETDASAERERAVAQMAAIIDAAGRISPGATLLIHSLAVPEFAPLGALDLNTDSGQRARVEAVNTSLRTLARASFPRVLLLDQERIEANFGKGRVRDDRLWHLAGTPYSESFLPVVAREQVRFAKALKGKARKCLVLDLDNTLWGGVVGEDGVEGLQIGGAAPGSAFTGFQTQLDGFRKRGILLAVCSKNNENDVWPVFETHPGMVLKREHLSASRINWQDKASNLVEIARELNIGVDSLVFVDDSPLERAQVRARLPDVLVVDLPADPSGYVRALASLDAFDTLAITDEDRRRDEMYREQSARQSYESSAGGDLDAYLHGLGTVVRLAQADGFDLARVTQLLNKTNQFNLTTKRYSEAEMRAFADDPSWLVVSARVSDRFGDSGLTGVALARIDGEVCEIDSFLLSCRVLARGVETAMLGYIHDAAKHAGATRLIATFIPTPKNAPAVDFLPKHGFVQMSTQPDGATVWERAVGDSSELRPAWLKIETDRKSA